jgi:hypothetical protein
MAAEYTRIDITQVTDFPRLAEEVSRSGRTHVVTRNDEELVEVKPAHRRSRRHGKTAAPATIKAALAASYQAVPALPRHYTLNELTEIAADEHAEAAAREGL